MKDKMLPWFLLFCAIGLSGTAAYYSVVGLSVVFVGVAIPVIILGSFLELSKIAIATYLHDKWKETYGGLKIYMTIALITLSIITSLGIYGLLSTGFSANISKLEINGKKIKNIEIKKQRFEEIKKEYQSEKTILDKDITNLRNALSSNTTTQSIDRNSGQVITRANAGNRKAFETQLKVAQQNRDIVSNKIESLNDSITNLEIEILNLESAEISGNELGTIKYMSELLDWDIKKTANLFILILIFVFDPLAITLVIATNQAFKSNKKNEETPQVTPQVQEDMNDPFEEYFEKHIDFMDEDIYEDDYDENIDYLDENFYQRSEESVENDEIINVDNDYGIFDDYKPNTVETENVVENKTPQPNPVINRRLSYTKNDTGNFKINRI